MNVLNIQEIPKSRNYIETLIMLINSDSFKKIKPKYILIESTQRKVVNRLSIPVDYNLKASNEDLNKVIKKVDSKNILTLPDIFFINNGNFKYIAYNLLYNFSSRAYISKVHHVKLNQKLFSIKDGNDLLFYHSDLKAISHNTKKNIEKVNMNLNKFAQYLKKYNIKLIFMPAVAKYDLYFDYIINNKYPRDPFFDNLRKLKKEYIFVDTKAILQKELQKGTKGIFYIDDTHWSYKASKAIVLELKKNLKDDI
jgi:glycerol-3-phosphate cytidylyltransferase-like family protein